MSARIDRQFIDPEGLPETPDAGTRRTDGGGDRTAAPDGGKGAEPVGPVGPSGPSPADATDDAGSDTGTAGAGANGSGGALPDAPMRVDPVPPEERPVVRLYARRWYPDDDPDASPRPPGLWWHGMERHGRGPAVPVDRRLCGPVRVGALARDPSENRYSLVLEFEDLDRRQRRLVVPRSELAGEARELERRLLDAGLDLAPGAFRRLRDWLQRAQPQERYRLATQTGWTEDLRSFVLPDLVLGEADVLLDATVPEGPRRGGDLRGWRETVALLEDNPLAAAAVLLALAAPLLRPLGEHSGGLHLFGPSTTGKTTALRLAASVWGPPNGYLRTWNATRNGLEAAAAAYNDALLALDEIVEARPEAVQDIIYQLGNDTGRTRARIDTGVRALKRWKVTLLSSGEAPIRQVIEQGGRSMSAGTTVRLLDVPAEGRFGIFDQLHGFGGGARFAEHLVAEVRRHHGHAGPALVGYMLKMGVEDVRAAHEESAEAVRREPKSVTTAIRDRGAKYFVMMRTAGMLAIEAHILPWRRSFVEACWRSVMRRWLEHAPSSLEDLVLEKVEGYLDRYGASRFEPIKGDESRPVRGDRDGWYEDVGDEERIWYFTPDGLSRALDGVADVETAARILKERGLLVRADKNRLQTKIRTEGRRVRVYAISFAPERSGGLGPGRSGGVGPRRSGGVGSKRSGGVGSKRSGGVRTLRLPTVDLDDDGF